MDIYTGENVRPLLQKCGNNVKLNTFCKICRPEFVEIGDNSRICDFVFIWGGKGVRIGKYTDMQPHVSIWGGGEIIIRDYVSVGLSSVLLTATYSHKEGLRMVDGLNENEAHALYGKLEIGNDVYIGANSTLMPNIIIGEGSVVGAGSVVTKDTDPYGIYVGVPAKKIGERPRLKI